MKKPIRKKITKKTTKKAVKKKRKNPIATANVLNKYVNKPVILVSSFEPFNIGPFDNKLPHSYTRQFAILKKSPFGWKIIAKNNEEIGFREIDINKIMLDLELVYIKEELPYPIITIHNRIAGISNEKLQRL